MSQLVHRAEQVYINNERLDISYELDIEAAHNLWQIDRLRAVDSDGKEVAYLKTAFIPKERFEKLCPEGLFGWLSKTKGYFLFGENDREGCQRFDKLDDVRLYESVKSFYWHAERKTIEPRNRFTREKLLEDLENLKPVLYKKYQGDYDFFLDYHIDKPEIAYVRLTDESYRGAGTALYGAGAIWMMQRGYVLHASGLQTEEAKRAWQRMVSYGWVPEETMNERSRMILDAKRVISSDRWQDFSPSPARKAKLKP